MSYVFKVSSSRLEYLARRVGNSDQVTLLNWTVKLVRRNVKKQKERSKEEGS